MSLLDLNAEDRLARAKLSYEPPKPADPGIFQNFIPGAGNYFMRGMAESGRALSMAGAAVPVLADKLIGSDNRGESFGDRYFRWHDETFGRAVDYWTPKPGEVGAAGQVVGSLAAGLTQFLANPALLVGTAQLSTAEDLVRQGVDAGAANVAGDLAGISTVAGIALPIFGKTLVGKIATGAAGNFATNVPQAAITRAVVQAAGAPEVAAQFDPLDLRARTVDLLMGVAFGAKSHIDARAAAKTQAFESPLTATQRDAIMVMNAARHMDEAALPWKAGEAEHTAAVDNVRTAIAQISRGQEVNVPPIPRGPVTDNPNFKAWFGDSKVVGEDGAPMVMYRGSPNEDARTYRGDGPVFVTADPSFAGHYAGANGAVYPLYVKAERAFDASRGEGLSLWRQFTKETDAPSYASAGTERGALPIWQQEHQLREWLAKKGIEYDAIWFAESNGRASLAVNDPSQIKSAIGNSGRFDPNSASLTDHADLAQSIADAAPKSADPVAAPEMRVHDVEKAMKTAQALSATIDAASADPATRVRLLKSEAQRLRSTADTAPTPDIAAHAKMAADMLENRAVFADDLRVPSGEFDPATGAPKTISANESIAKATAEAEHVKATAEGLMRTVATCILGGI